MMPRPPRIARPALRLGFSLGMVWLLLGGCGQQRDGRVAIDLVAGCRPGLDDLRQAAQLFCLSIERPSGQALSEPDCAERLEDAQLAIDEPGQEVVVVVEGFEQLADGGRRPVVRGKSPPVVLLSGVDERVSVPLAPVGRFGLLAADEAGCTPLPLALAGHSATVFPSGHLLLLGTSRSQANPERCGLLIDGHTQQLSPLATPVSLRRFGHLAAKLAGGRLLIAGGTLAPEGTATTEMVMLRGAELLQQPYEPGLAYAAQLSFETLQRPLVHPRARPAGAVFFGRQVLIVDGQNPAEMFLGDSEVSELLTVSGSQPYPFNGNTVAPVAYAEDRAMLVGVANRLGRLTVANGFAEAIYQGYGTTAVARDLPVSLLLPDGRVLVLGGRVGSNSESPVVLVDPGDGGDPGLTPIVAPAGFPEQGHAAVLLPDGRALVTGGVTPDGRPAGSFLIGQVEGDRWEVQPGPDLLLSRRGHTASLLPDGRVVVVGGDPVVAGDPDPSRSVEVIAF